jgi:predicted DNA-binding transcriptional regulator YafY
MNRTDRLLAIVLELQRHRRSYCRAEDLAARFEVSKRTIYRDIQALCEVGVPIAVADRRGYALVEGYFLPPLSFTTDEALILSLGSDFMATTFDDDYRAAAYAAYRKIDAVLPPPLRTQVDHLKDGLHVAPTNRLDTAQRESLRVLRHAVATCTRIRIQYSTQDVITHTPVQTIREVDPYHLTRLADDWYLTGYCHLRQAIRMFRLTRMHDVFALEQTFAHEGAVARGRTEGEADQSIFVQAIFAHGAAHVARESQHALLLDEEETPAGVRMTFLTTPGTALVRWLLGFGGSVRVCEPAWIQAALIGQAEQILKNYSDARLDD